jgi:hypothetical protein
VTGRRSDQAVMAVVRLVGPQSAEATVMHPGTDDAAVTIRIGKTLLYLHQEQTAEHFLHAWAEGAEAAKALPMQADWRPVRALRGMPDPAVAAHAVGRPASNVVTGRQAGPGREPYLRVQLGRIAFEVRDQRAYLSCVNAFKEAHRLAKTAFLMPGEALIVHGAMDLAADAFFPASRPADHNATPTTVKPCQSSSRDRLHAVSNPQPRPLAEGQALRM